MADKVPVQVDKLIEQAVKQPDVPKIYANGFGVGLSNADVVILFNRMGNNPTAVVNLSYTLAKTLAQKLGRLVSDFERMVGNQELLTTEKIDEAFAKEREAKAAAKAEKLESADQKGPTDEVH